MKTKNKKEQSIIPRDHSLIPIGETVPVLTEEQLISLMSAAIFATKSSDALSLEMNYLAAIRAAIGLRNTVKDEFRKNGQAGK